jgi:hypothetical protein
MFSLTSIFSTWLKHSVTNYAWIKGALKLQARPMDSYAKEYQNFIEGMVVHSYNTSYWGGWGRRIPSSSQPGQLSKLCLIIKFKRGRGVTPRWSTCLACMRPKVQSSILKKKKKKKNLCSFRFCSAINIKELLFVESIIVCQRISTFILSKDIKILLPFQLHFWHTRFSSYTWSKQHIAIESSSQSSFSPNDSSTPALDNHCPNICPYIYICLLWIFFFSTGLWTQGLILAKYVLYHLSHASSLTLHFHVNGITRYVVLGSSIL